MTGGQESGGLVTGINVTPLVDIMLVLLIVFMVTARFAGDAAIQVRLPTASSAEAAPTPSLTVTLDAKGGLFLLEEPVDENGLSANLEREARLNPGVRVTLAADQDLAYRKVVQTLDLIKRAGVTRVALASER